ncbi:MAG TPA: GNAT family N-acetyltransferase [Dysgonomonas sp.]|nr:GNAT family N-acetyltransferase [Dysgonomonas sp.]
MEIKLVDKEYPYDLLYLADPSEEAVADYLHRGKCYVAYSEDKIVGEYVLLPTRPFTIELVNVAVAEEYHGKGIGKKLVKHAISMAKNQKYKVIEVGTGDAGIGQLALYQKCGFMMASIDFNFFKKHYSETIIENGIECRHMVRLSMDL